MTVISGWRDSQASTVAGSRSGRRIEAHRLTQQTISKAMLLIDNSRHDEFRFGRALLIHFFV
jgi:hypothetical protein